LVPFLRFRSFDGDVVKELEGRTDIGRAPECDVVLNDATVSRRHALIVREGNDFFIQDAGSRFGTSVNGESLQSKVRLKHGDKISLGNAEAVFDEKGTSEAEQRSGQKRRKPLWLERCKVKSPL
jgi:pSer/pThr/pTyr-binding forkhead associated (FHA) protein